MRRKYIYLKTWSISATTNNCKLATKQALTQLENNDILIDTTDPFLRTEGESARTLHAINATYTAANTDTNTDTIARTNMNKGNKFAFILRQR